MLAALRLGSVRACLLVSLAPVAAVVSCCAGWIAVQRASAGGMAEGAPVGALSLPCVSDLKGGTVVAGRDLRRSVAAAGEVAPTKHVKPTADRNPDRQRFSRREWEAPKREKASAVRLQPKQPVTDELRGMEKGRNRWTGSICNISL